MSTMFDWLADEMESIKTPKFHLVDGPASDELREVIRRTELAVPPSYIAFVLRFGNAKLYRLSGVYQVQVYAGPREERSKEGEELIHFGRTDMGLAYFKDSFLRAGEETPVLEWNGPSSGLRKTASGFEEWLRKKCAKAKRYYGKKRWQRILDGPVPFSDEELTIVAARRKFTWRVVGITGNGNLRIEIHNGSDMTLSYLSLGVKLKHESERFGGVGIPVSHIVPGETAVVEHDCYKEHPDAANIEIVDKPDPGPEDRDLYSEFRTD